jgi:hypothetical protein
MSQIDYYAIEEAIETQLNNSLTTVGVKIDIEYATTMDISVPWIGIFLVEAPRNVAVIRATTGPYNDVKPTFGITCRGYNLESMAEACRQRDNLLKEVEEVLQLDTSIQSTVSMSNITNTDFEAGTESEGFYSEGTITLVTELRG